MDRNSRFILIMVVAHAACFYIIILQLKNIVKICVLFKEIKATMSNDSFQSHPFFDSKVTPPYKSSPKAALFRTTISY